MIKLGLVGLGRWGKNIVRTLESFSECEVQATNDHREFLEQKFDGILIATPGTTHFEIATSFIERGAPLFIEKPLTTSYQDALKLEQLTQKSGSMIMVGHVHLYNPAFLKAKEIVQTSGKIRTLFFEGTNNGPYRDDMSAIWDWAPHDVVMALDLIGEIPSHVQAWGIKSLRPESNLYDTAVLKLEFPSGITAITIVSWLFPEKRKKLTITAEKNSIIFDDTAQKKLTLFENMGPVISEKSVERQEPVVSYPEYSTDQPLTLELQAFLEVLKTKQQPKASLSQGIQVVKIIDAAHQSIQLEGQKIEI